MARPSSSPRTCDVRIFASELHAIVDEVGAHPHVETGGDLLGLWSHGGTPTIFLATRPGPAAIRARMYFQQDARTHRAVERLAWERFGAQCVGLWHSHHRLGLPVPSRGDLARTMRYARRYRRERFVDLLAFFDPGIVLRPFLHRDATIARIDPTRLVVIPGESPLRTALAGALPPDLAPALQGAPPGPPRPWSTRPGTPIRPDEAPTEGDAPAVLPPPADEAGPGPWRAVDAVERLVDDLVPEEIQASMDLEILQDALVLRLSHRRRTLTVLLSHDGGLRLHGWTIQGARPRSGGGGGDLRGRFTAALTALMEG